MNILKSLLATVIIFGTLTARTVLAADTPGEMAEASAAQAGKDAAVTGADESSYRAMLKDASAMMGHIGIANIALLHNLNDEAASNTTQALALARKLEDEAVSFNSKPVKTGKLQFLSATGEKRDYWLPIEDDTFVVDSFSGDYLKSRGPKTDEEDAQVVNTRIALNTKQVRQALEKAAASIEAGKYVDAQVALMDAAQSTFTDQTIGEGPLTTAGDDFGLAKSLLKNNDYDGAGFALGHAKEALEEYQKTADKSREQKAQKLETAISAVQAEIARDHPQTAKVDSPGGTTTLFQGIESRVSTWIHDIESWGSTKG